MKKNIYPILSNNRQSGAVLLIMVLVLGLVISTVLISQLVLLTNSRRRIEGFFQAEHAHYTSFSRISNALWHYVHGAPGPDDNFFLNNIDNSAENNITYQDATLNVGVTPGPLERTVISNSDFINTNRRLQAQFNGLEVKPANIVIMLDNSGSMSNEWIASFADPDDAFAVDGDDIPDCAEGLAPSADPIANPYSNTPRVCEPLNSAYEAVNEFITHFWQLRVNSGVDDVNIGLHRYANSTQIFNLRSINAQTITPSDQLNQLLNDIDDSFLNGGAGHSFPNPYIPASHITASGFTDINAALEEGRDILISATDPAYSPNPLPINSTNTQSYLILITDGVSNASASLGCDTFSGTCTPGQINEEIEDTANLIKNNTSILPTIGDNIILFVVGYGVDGERNDILLNTIATGENDFGYDADPNLGYDLLPQIQNIRATNANPFIVDSLYLIAPTSEDFAEAFEQIINIISLGINVTEEPFVGP